MFKKFLSLILTVIILMTSTNLILADTAPETKLNDMGLLLNISDEELDQVLTRDVGLTMILKSLGYDQSDADAASVTTPFRDVDGWAKGWAALAYDLGITTGVAAESFNPKGILTEKEFVTFQLRALEYDKSDAWDNAVSLAKTAGLIDSASTLSDTLFTKREAAEVMYSALSSKLQSTKVDLIEKLIADDVVSEALAKKYELIVDEFKLKSVIASNYKLVQLQFNDDVDEESLTDATIDVHRNDTDIMYDDDILNDVTPYKYAFDIIDARTINVVFGTAYELNDIITVNINGLKSEDGDVIEGYTIESKLKDNTSPYAVSVDSVNAKLVKVLFSEPVQIKIGSKVFDNVFIDDKRVAATATLSSDKQTVTYELNDKLSVGTHTLKIDGATDYAGYSAEEKTFSFETVNDTTVPYVTFAKAPNRNEVVVEFNEDINKTKGYIKVNGKTYNMTSDDVTIDGNKVYIELETSLSASDAFASIKGYYDNIEDLIGNKVADETEFTFNADFDSSIPTLSASVSSNNEIVVTFSEDVQAFTSINYAISDEDDDLVPSSVSPSGSSKSVFKITLGNPTINKTTYTLIVKGVKDLSLIQNTISDLEIELEMYDKLQPKIKSVKKVDDETVRITYNEPMNVSLIGNPEYYMFTDTSESSTLPVSQLSDYTIEVSDDAEYVDITIDGLVLADKIAVQNVKDESGMVLQNYNTKWSITAPNEFIVSDLKATLIEPNEVKVEATGHEFKVVDPDDFVLRTTTGDSKYHYVSSAMIDGDDASIVYLTLNSDLDSDAKYDGLTQYMYLIDDSITTDIYNQNLEITYSSPLSIEDGMAPIAELDLDTADTIIVTFSERVNAPSDTAVENTVVIKDKDDNYVNLTIGGNMSYSGYSANNTGFKTLTITGLTGGEEYKVKVESSYIVGDEGLSCEKLGELTVTVKE